MSNAQQQKTGAAMLLAKQLKLMQTTDHIPGISVGLVDDGDVFEWEVMLMISDECKFYGVFTNGTVCISILHPPEEDSTGYESASERWSPVQTPATILLSVISMLSSPNDESAANVEAARQWRDDPAAFKKKVRMCVRDSLEA
ncbi:hypothetical protein FKW77_008522 [Venturia effusa]|uniref:UBC core domain-containing protein n=1 Tax=Venturia effusa TaxID=50376 RepID=A0A517KX08_9PEZI|nr:hypothetical protein FKW77_008522 [Venturia effusa]